MFPFKGAPKPTALLSQPGDLILGSGGLPDVAYLDTIRAEWNRVIWDDPSFSSTKATALWLMWWESFEYINKNWDYIQRLERQADREGGGSARMTLDAIRPLQLPAVGNYLEKPKNPRHTPDARGFYNYMNEIIPLDRMLADERWAYRPRFSQAGLIDSALVVAPRGWGKSELLKALVRHAIEAPNDKEPAGTVVVLDPGGDLVRQIARWPELSGADRHTDRLVYIEPGLVAGHTVGLNPLDGTGLDHPGRNTAARMLAHALDANTAPLSMNMETLIMHCATVLLSRPGSTLRDLHDMLEDPEEDAKAHELCEFAKTYPDPDVHRFFARSFLGEGFSGTKVWLRGRLENLFADHFLASMFGGRETVSLRQEIEGRQVVLVNLQVMRDKATIRTAGRMIVAAVGATVQARGSSRSGPRAPVLLVVDEVTMIAGNELVDMLAQLRRYGLNMIVAQQVGAAGFAPEEKATLLNNTRGRFIGELGPRGTRELLSLPSQADDLPEIKHRQFWARWRDFDGPQLLNVRSDLSDNSLAVSDREWAEVVADATGPEEAGGYYRPDKEFAAAPTAPSPTPPPPPAAGAGEPVPPAPSPAPPPRSGARPVVIEVRPKKPKPPGRRLTVPEPD